MHRPSLRSSTIAIGLFLVFGACAKKPALLPGNLSPASAPDAAVTAATSAGTFTCPSNGELVPDDTQRICVPYAGTPKGDAQAPIAVVIFSDFECRYCQRVVGTLNKLDQAYPCKLRFYFRHLPLPFHTEAKLAAQAAVAADNQGRFWPMHDLLFAQQPALARDNLIQYAQTLGLDMDRFNKDLDAPETAKRVENDQQLAEALSVEGTPNFFINGRNIRGAVPIAEFQKIIDDELGRARKLGHASSDGLYAALMQGQGKGLGTPSVPAPPPKIPVGDDVFKVEVDGAPQKGGKEPKVTLVAFMDFQCPFSARAMKTLKSLLARYPDDLRVVFRHYTLLGHMGAKRAALGTMAAERQGKFWELAEFLFAHQRDLSAASLVKSAADLGLDMEKFKAAVVDPRHMMQLIYDKNLGDRLGVEGTPSFFINGRRFFGAYPLESFANLIDEELGRVRTAFAKGMPATGVYATLIKNGLDRAPAKAEGEHKVKTIDVGNAPSRGPADAPVTLVVFSDFQCPFCARLEASLAEVDMAYPGKLRFVWKNAPLPFHARAKPSAEAALAAHEQGMFWPMQAKLLENQDALDDQSLERYAREVGLDMKKFTATMASHKFAAAVEADIRQGESLGVEGTPTTFVNGYPVSGAQPPAVFKARVDEALAKAARK